MKRIALAVLATLALAAPVEARHSHHGKAAASQTAKHGGKHGAGAKKARATKMGRTTMRRSHHARVAVKQRALRGAHHGASQYGHQAGTSHRQAYDRQQAKLHGGKHASRHHRNDSTAKYGAAKYGAGKYGKAKYGKSRYGKAKYGSVKTTSRRYGHAAYATRHHRTRYHATSRHHAYRTTARHYSTRHHATRYRGARHRSYGQGASHAMPTYRTPHYDAPADSGGQSGGSFNNAFKDIRPNGASQ